MDTSEIPDENKLKQFSYADLLIILKHDPDTAGMKRKDYNTYLGRNSTERKANAIKRILELRENMERSSKASTSSSKAAQPSIDDIHKWNTDQVIKHLQAQFPGDFDNEDLEVLQKRKIRGRAFLKLTEEKLMAHGMELGPASVIAGYIEELNAANQAKTSEINPIQTFHIIVKPRTTTTFAWDVNTNECTINDIKNKITANYPEMTEETVNARVVIFVDKESRIMVDDTDLRMTLKTFANSGIEKFTVIFQTPKKAYNKWSIKEVLKDVLKSEIQDYTDLPPLDIEKLLSDHPIDYTEAETTAFIQNLKNIFKAFQGDVAKNEATSRNFINPFMIAAVCKLNQHDQKLKQWLLKLLVEYELDGSLGFGKVDYAILLLTFAILVTEAKMMSFPQGMAQNLVQLHTASEKLKLKRKRDNTPVLPEVYGIVSTGRSWRFICWKVSSGKPTVEISKEYLCRFENQMQDELQVLQIISTILSVQASQLRDLIERGEFEVDQPGEGRASQRRRMDEVEVAVENDG